MNYLVAPRNYDRDFGGRTPGFGDMDEYGLPRGMSPEDKREVLDRFPLPGERGGVDTRGPSITPGSNPMGVSTEMPSVGFAAKDRGPMVPQHRLDPTTPEEREAHRIRMGEPKIDTRGMDPFSPNPFGDRLLDYLNQLERNGKFKDLLFRPTDTFDITKPVYRPEDKVEVQPLELATNYTTYTDVLPEDIEIRRRIEDAAEEKSPAIKLDPSKLDLREYRQPGPYRPGEDLMKDQFIRSERSPIASNPETGKRDFLYQYLEQNKEVMGPKNQMFGRYADPDDGTLNNDEMAQLDPTGELLLRSLRKGEIGPLTDPNIQKAIRDLERQKYNRGRASSMEGALMAADPVDKAAHGPQMTRSQFSNYMEKRNPGFKSRTDALRMELMNAGILRGV